MIHIPEDLMPALLVSLYLVSHATRSLTQHGLSRDKDEKRCEGKTTAAKEKKNSCEGDYSILKKNSLGSLRDRASFFRQVRRAGASARSA